MSTTGYRGSAQRIGNRIREARTEAGFSQEKLAARINTSRRNMLRWENGHNTPRAEHIIAIARETGKSVEFFLGDEDEEEAALAQELILLIRRITLGSLPRPEASPLLHAETPSASGLESDTERWGALPMDEPRPAA